LKTKIWFPNTFTSNNSHIVSLLFRCHFVYLYKSSQPNQKTNSSQRTPLCLEEGGRKEEEGRKEGDQAALVSSSFFFCNLKLFSTKEKYVCS
jgi:hypothetical protein